MDLAAETAGHSDTVIRPNHPIDDVARSRTSGLQMAAEGMRFANIHTVHVQEGGMKPVNDEEIALWRHMDPQGLITLGTLTEDEVTETHIIVYLDRHNTQLIEGVPPQALKSFSEVMRVLTARAQYLQGHCTEQE